MEDSLDKAIRKWIPASEASLLKQAINGETDITLKHSIKRGKLISLRSMDGKREGTWDISDSD